MTRLADGTVATDIDSDDNARLTNAGYTIRHIETWHGPGQSCIIWDWPRPVLHHLGRAVDHRGGLPPLTAGRPARPGRRGPGFAAVNSDPAGLQPQQFEPGKQGEPALRAPSGPTGRARRRRASRRPFGVADADKVIRELAQREWIAVSMDELEAVENAG